MSFQSILFNLRASKSDRQRNRAIPVPSGISQCRNITYGPHGRWNQLDVYFPNGTTRPLPTIVSIHGGGYVYGNKEVYRRYGMDLAQRGFSFVNFNYRLAPKWRFPTPLEDTNSVLEWIYRNAAKYHLDPDRIILIGDSTGAQLASQYAAIYSNPNYASHFSFRLPPVQIRAMALNCGIYTLDEFISGTPTGLVRDYLGPAPNPADPRFQILQAITPNYPSTYITTAYHDFLIKNAKTMYELLLSRNVKCTEKCYGSSDTAKASHAFHLSLTLPEAVQCNDEECEFFRNCI